MVEIGLFQDFLRRALRDFVITDEVKDYDEYFKYLQETYQFLCGLQKVYQEKNQELVELSNCSSHPQEKRFLLLHLALEVQEIIRYDEDDLDKNFSERARILNSLIKLKIRSLKQNLVDYDLSFFSSQGHQTVLGKPTQAKLLSFFRPYLNTMEVYFWLVDEKGDEKYLKTAEKKLFKVAHDGNDKLIYAKNSQQKLNDGHYMYIVSPKGSLYMIEEPGAGHHSVIRAGQPVLSAGMLRVENGEIWRMDCTSGHYQPDSQSFILACLHLYEQKILTKNCEFSLEFTLEDILKHEDYAALSNEYRLLL